MTVILYNAKDRSIYADSRHVSEKDLIVSDKKKKIKTFTGVNQENKNPLNKKIIATSLLHHQELHT